MTQSRPDESTLATSSSDSSFSGIWETAKRSVLPASKIHGSVFNKTGPRPTTVAFDCAMRPATSFRMGANAGSSPILEGQTPNPSRRYEGPRYRNSELQAPSTSELQRGMKQQKFWSADRAATSSSAWWLAPMMP